MKNLTYDVVVKKALDLIAAYGQTTTLDVKSALREDGYFAKQSDVSDFMNDAYNDARVAFMDTGEYRIYSWFSITVDASAIMPDPVIDPPLTIKDVMVLDKEEAGCWIVYNYNDKDEKMYIHGSVSRNVARAYGKGSLGDYDNIAANRSKVK